MKLHLRRIKMDDWPNRGDINWVLFEEGKFDTPIVIISDINMGQLVDSFDEQEERHNLERLKK